MQTCIDEIVCWSQMIFSVTAVDEREVLQVGIIIEGEIVEHDDTEKLQNLHRSCLNIPADDVSTLLVTQIAVFEIAASIGICQSCKRCKIFLAILLSIWPHIKPSAQICCFVVTEETNRVGCRFNLIYLRSYLHSQVLIGRTILAVKQGV